MKSWRFAQTIINWQHTFGRNNLPWQTKHTPYHIWISEIMLQQTQVKTVIPYFNKFISKFHNIYTLYQTHLDEILYLWSGLGYYSRARNLYKTAKIIIEKYHGKFPKNIISLINLPGIGKTTAGAILSFGYNLSFPILDGNVKRILIRFYNISGNIKSKIIENKLWKIITIITPVHHANKFNQGMMDLGSLICINKNPKCYICPIHQNCIYRLNKIHTTISIPKSIIKKKYFFIILQYKQFIFLERIQNTKIWKSLFCFPAFKDKKNITDWLIKNNIMKKNYRMINSINHKFSHLILKMHIFQLILPNQYKLIPNKNSIWYNLFHPQHIGIPQPVQKILLMLKNNTVKHQDNENESNFL